MEGLLKPKILKVLTINGLTMYSDLPPRNRQRVVEPDSAIVNAHKALMKSRAKLLAKEGLSPPQFNILKVIANKGPMLMRRLSRELLVTPPNITGIIDRLEKRRLVRRVAGTEDRRASIIELTEEGRNLYGTLAQTQRIFIQNVLKALTPDEQLLLSTFLTKLKEEILRRDQIGQ